MPVTRSQLGGFLALVGAETLRASQHNAASDSEHTVWFSYRHGKKLHTLSCMSLCSRRASPTTQHCLGMGRNTLHGLVPFSPARLLPPPKVRSSLGSFRSLCLLQLRISSTPQAVKSQTGLGYLVQYFIFQSVFCCFLHKKHPLDLKVLGKWWIKQCQQAFLLPDFSGTSTC